MNRPLPTLLGALGCCEILEESLRLLKVGGVEAFGEPIVDAGESCARVSDSSLRGQPPRQAQARTQLPRPCDLPAGDLDRPAEALHGFVDVVRSGGEA